MSVAVDLGKLADLCLAAAVECDLALFNRGPPPTDSHVKALLWDQTTRRLRNQIQSLTEQVPRLNAAAVAAALDAMHLDLSQLGRASVAANVSIKNINNVAKLMTTVTDVLDVGIAVLAVAAVPNPATGANLVRSVAALAKQVS